MEREVWGRGVEEERKKYTKFNWIVFAPPCVNVGRLFVLFVRSRLSRITFGVHRHTESSQFFCNTHTHTHIRGIKQVNDSESRNYHNNDHFSLKQCKRTLCEIRYRHLEFRWLFFSSVLLPPLLFSVCRRHFTSSWRWLPESVGCYLLLNWWRFVLGFRYLRARAKQYDRNDGWNIILFRFRFTHAQFHTVQSSIHQSLRSLRAFSDYFWHSPKIYCLPIVAMNERSGGWRRCRQRQCQCHFGRLMVISKWKRNGNFNQRLKTLYKVFVGSAAAIAEKRKRTIYSPLGYLLALWCNTTTAEQKKMWTIWRERERLALTEWW